MPIIFSYVSIFISSEDVLENLMNFERAIAEEYSFPLDPKSIRLCGLYFVIAYELYVFSVVDPSSMVVKQLLWLGTN